VAAPEGATVAQLASGSARRRLDADIAVRPRALIRIIPPRPQTARSVTRATLVAVAGAVLYGHVQFLRHAGGLWRDEAGTAAFASMPSLAAIWSALHYDSVPLASTLLVRGWIALGLGSDMGLRVLGLIVGCTVPAALALNARVQGARIPSCSVALLALNVWAIRGGDAIRPAGLGMLFVVLTFASLGAFIERPRRAWAVAAAACAVLGVHSIYSNAGLVGAIALAGAAAGVALRSPIRILASAGVGLAAALSLLPYLPAVRVARDWGVLMQAQGVDLPRIWVTFQGAASWDWGLWVVLVVAGLAVALVRLGGGGSRTPARTSERTQALYAGATLAIGVLAFIGFVLWSQLATKPWYYLPLMALGGASLDVLAGPLVRRPAPRIALCVAMLLITVAHLVAAAPQLRVRQTNVDLIAAKLNATVAPGDLVVVNPWFLGVTFDRYYHGPAPWITIPPLDEVRIHRYDLVKRCMQDPTCVDSVGRTITTTFASGGRVWLVGHLPSLPPGTAPPPTPRAPTPELGWSVDSYDERWGKVVLASIAARVASTGTVHVAAPGEVSRYENVALFVLIGGR